MNWDRKPLWLQRFDGDEEEERDEAPVEVPFSDLSPGVVSSATLELARSIACRNEPFPDAKPERPRPDPGRNPDASRRKPRSRANT